MKASSSGCGLSQSCHPALLDLGQNVDDLLTGAGLRILIDSDKVPCSSSQGVGGGRRGGVQVSGGLGRHVGNRVLVGGAKEGTLRYYGPLHLKPEADFCGVELLEPAGKHDGSLDGRFYFHCPPGHGIFAPRSKVQLIAVTTLSFAASTPSPDADDSKLNRTFDFTDSGIDTSTHDASSALPPLILPSVSFDY